MASDDRTGRKQISDLAGLFTGKTKIQQGRIVPKNPPPPPPAPAPPGPDIHVGVDVDVNSD